MINNNEQRNFIKMTTLVSVGLGMGIKEYSVMFPRKNRIQEKSVGIIGLDTSHCIEFTKNINAPNPEPDIAGYMA
ncbi:hypothetical protein K8352_15165 [Flavobacteriaceae bacterium F89]|uniref:Uncharacterized protein n=1 Tax=Cerina litoralis TaxID=2874477 RepID=A0AAE3EWD2_9FLAO|nr:hypothetical protein [Cerina litoralis]MCG2462098.1 hypothetical protein [Cerina litoralis]